MVREEIKKNNNYFLEFNENEDTAYPNLLDTMKAIQDLDKDLFFIKMTTYKKNGAWARKINRLACKTADLININCSFDKILDYIKENLTIINDNPTYCSKKEYISYFGIYKDSYKRGCEYYNTYKKICDDFEAKDVFDKYQPKGHEKNTNVCQIEFKDATSSMPPHIKIIYGCNFAQKGSNFDIVKKVYKDFKKIKKPTKEQIDFTTAKIQWLIAQESPFVHGNDSLANILTKAIYISQGYKTSPVKSGKSLDFEAFYRDLDDYIKIYPKLFEIEPYKI